MPISANTIADLKKALISRLYPYSPVYNYMEGANIDKLVLLSAATGARLDVRDKLQYHPSHAAMQVGKEYVLQIYNQNGNQYTMQDNEDGQRDYPPPMTEHTTGYDHEVPDHAEDTEETPISKKRRYN